LCWDLHRHDGVRVVVSYLWVKLHTSAELRIYSNSPCPRYWASYGVVSQLVFLGMGWCELFWNCVRQLCRVLRRTGSPVAVLRRELRVATKTDFKKGLSLK